MINARNKMEEPPFSFTDSIFYGSNHVFDLSGSFILFNINLIFLCKRYTI